MLLLGSVATPAAREYQTVDFKLLNVTIDTVWAPRAAPGYLPVRFEITNFGDARIIEIVGQGTRAYRGPRGLATGSTFARQSVRLARGDRVRLTMPVPIYADSENIRFEFRERNSVIYTFNYNGLQSRVAAKDASALLVAAPGSPLGTIVLRSTRPAFPGPPTSGSRGGGGTVVITPTLTMGRPGSGPTLDFQLEPARLPANWLGYTSLRAVVIGPTAWEQLTAEQKSALLTWTASGGDLIFVDGDVKALLPSAQLQPSTSPDGLVARHLFGRVHAVKLASVALGLTDLLAATDVGRELPWVLPVNSAPDWGAIERRGFRLGIPGIDGVPARVYLGILLLFSVLIGPLNYWILRRKRQQVLMVVTAPLISAAFIVLLAAYAIAGEGFRVQGRAVTFTMLDQVTRQAVTRATVSLYAPGLTPSDGLRFGRDTAVWAVGPEGTGMRDRMELDLTDAQQFSAGVLQARSPTNLEQITLRSARERLTLSPADGGMSVTNGLDATILGLIYRDGNTTYRLDGPLSSGVKQTITASAFDPQRALPDGVSIPPKLAGLFQNQPRGWYLAVLEHSPFWEPGVSRLLERGSVHVVLGWPEGQR